MGFENHLAVHRPTRFSLIAAAACLAPGSWALGQEPTIETLRATIEQRDQVILELLERVEALERRLGMQPKQPVTSRDAGPLAGTADPESPEDPGRTRSESPAGTANEDAGSAAPGRVIADDASAERALERALTQSGALLLDPGRVEVQVGMNYQRDESFTPAFVERDGDILVGRRERNIDVLNVGFTALLGLPGDAQLEFGLPYRWLDRESATTVGFAPERAMGDSVDGLGDLDIGLAKTLARAASGSADLVGRITWDTRSGEDDNAALSPGSGFDEIRASLTAIKRQDPVVFLGSLSYEHVLERDDLQPGPAIGTTLGGFIALNPRTSLSLLVSGTYRDETKLAGSEVGGSDQVAASLVIGGSTLLRPQTLLNVSTEVGLTDDADDFSLSLSLVRRFRSPLF